MELVVPFLSDDPVYCHGVEFGFLFRQMSAQEETIKGIYHRANDEQFFLMASRMGYSAEWRKVDETWFEATFTLSTTGRRGV